MLKIRQYNAHFKYQKKKKLQKQQYIVKQMNKGNKANMAAKI